MKSDPKMLLESAARNIKTADHLIYVTYSIIKEKRLMIKIFERLYSSILDIINAILQHEYANKRIKIYDDARINFETFKNSCASRYGILPEQLDYIAQILSIMRKHKESPIEFTRHEKYIIMSDDLRTDSITIQQLKGFLFTIKEVLRKAELGIRK
jgi:hypothetical protein